MVRLNRIYTRTGDAGETGLAGGERRPKDDPRIEAYGTIDELNAVLGHSTRLATDEARELLARIQNDLFDLGADLATPGAEEGLRIVEGQVKALEAAIDVVNEHLDPLTSFVLPGGSELSCWLHQARTVCRRAERLVVGLARVEELNPVVIPYLNRLSDLLFVLARVANDQGKADVLWIPGQNREPAGEEGSKSAD